MSISKKIRFEVFKRDGFRCAYCGKSPPDVLLEIDHIEPKSKGGKDDVNNYLTACFDCNRGKRAISLNLAPLQLSENLNVLQEKELQLRKYNKLISKVENRLNIEVEEIEKVFHEGFQTKIRFTESFKRSVKGFLKALPKSEVLEAMLLTVDRKKCCGESDIERALRYFCGICWNKIKDKRREAYD